MYSQTSRCKSCLVSDEMSSLLAPRQLGYGIPGGVEAAVHAARYLLYHMDDSSAFLKLDFRHAFNSIHRSKMLAAVKQFAPTIFLLLLSLFWEESGEGVQKGDPLGFVIQFMRLCKVDDLSLGGNVETLIDDLQTILLLESYGLHLITSIITDNFTTFNFYLPYPLSVSLLRSPLGHLDCVSAFLGL